MADVEDLRRRARAAQRDWYVADATYLLVSEAIREGRVRLEDSAFRRCVAFVDEQIKQRAYERSLKALSDALQEREAAAL